MPYVIDGSLRGRELVDMFVVYMIVPVMCFIRFCVIGELKNHIIFDEEFMILQQRKQPPLKIRWDEVEKILRTRYTGGKALVFWDKYGRKIWFNSSKRLDKYILSNHPELAPLFPAKNDVRKWEQWDKKLRF
jgi:hypothetical protein